MTKQFYDPPDVFSPVAIYSHAVRCGRMLTLAGQAPLNDDGTVVGRGDAEVQCRRVFADLKRTLDLAGATFAHVVYVRAYLTDKAVLPVVHRVASGIFSGNRPAFTAIVIPSCRGEDVMVEIELVLDLADSSP